MDLPMLSDNAQRCCPCGVAVPARRVMMAATRRSWGWTFFSFFCCCCVVSYLVSLCVPTRRQGGDTFCRYHFTIFFVVVVVAAGSSFAHLIIIAHATHPRTSKCGLRSIGLVGDDGGDGEKSLWLYQCAAMTKTKKTCDHEDCRQVSE